ncbi:MAG: YncE family protein [Bacteroidia bacterium]|nr:YncE family protein [Bacteroidia bacterium]
MGIILLWGCRRIEEISLDKRSNFPPAVAQILVQRCAGCHRAANYEGGYTRGHGGAPSSNPSWVGTKINLASWDSLFYAYRGELTPVVPGNPDWSHLLWHINRYPELGPTAVPLMPPPTPDSSNLLSRGEIEVLRQWIIEGARNAKGELPWAHRMHDGRRKAFVCSSGSDLIAVIDLDTYGVMYYIPVGALPRVVEAPHYVQVSPDGKYLYVTLISGAAIEKYRTDTYEKVGRLEVGADPAHIEFSPDGRHAVITHFTTTAPVKLTLIDAENLIILDELRDPLGQIIARPHGLWLTPDFRYAYVTANNGNYITKVEISPSRNSFVDFTQIPLERGGVPQSDTRWGPYQILAEPTGKFYFVTCDASNEVRVFSRFNDSLVAVIPTAAAPKLMAYHRGLLYVACLKAAAPPLQGEKRGAIAVIDTENLRLLTHIYNTGHLPRGIAVDPIKNQLFVSFENLAGTDPPHHYTEGLSGAPGKVYVLQIPTFQLRGVKEVALAAYGMTLLP